MSTVAPPRDGAAPPPYDGTTPHTGDPAAPFGPGTWSLTWHGVSTVARLELRQRVRSTRWVVSLVVFGVVVGAITLLTWASLNSIYWGLEDGGPGAVMFGIIVFFVLFLGMLTAPALTSSSINGDRAAGTLAILQVTTLSAAEIVFGKLLAAWLASLAFLAVSMPFILLAWFGGGVPVLTMLGSVLLLGVLLAVVCAIGLGFSALTARTSASAVLSYTAVASLSLLTLVFFGLSLAVVTQDEEVTVHGVDWNSYRPSYDEHGNEVWEPEVCETYTEVRSVSHTERTWWLLAANPFVVVADAATSPDLTGDTLINDPLSAIAYGVRSARTGPPEVHEECWVAGYDWTETVHDHPPAWPWGLGFNLLLGGAGVYAAVRRLRIPQGTLARGTRVA